MNQLCKLCERNVVLCPIEVNKIYDSVKIINNINSNLPITFTIFSECDLSSNTKVDLMESNFEYSIFNLKKSVYVYGIYL